jgi:hypothetical protein
MSVCLRCGYDLRATPPEAPCPECGLAAHRSVFEHFHPDDCPPRWVASIALASVLLLISYVGLALFFAFMVFAPPQFGNVMFGVNINIFGRIGPWSPQWMIIGLLALAVLHAIANFLLSRNDRRHATRRISRMQRWALRIVPLSPIVGLGLIEYVYWFQPNVNGNWWPSYGNYRTASDWLCALLAFCPAITFYRLRWLAMRLSRPRVAEHVTIVAVGCAAALLLLIIFETCLWRDIRDADIYFIAVVVLPCAMMGLFNLWAMFLLFVVTQRFLQSATEARARWRAADAARAG